VANRIHLTSRQYGRLLDGWLALIGLDPAAYGTRSLFRIKVVVVYKRRQPARLPAPIQGSLTDGNFQSQL